MAEPPANTDIPRAATARAPEKIAIIAVHGVGSQEPHVTACDLAGLLQRATPGTYSEFSQAVLELEVTKPAIQRSPHHKNTKKHWYVRSPYARLKSADATADATAGTKTGAGPTAESDDIAFTRLALSEVELDPELQRYNTRVLSGTRGSGANTRSIDIYEMYWADLSHLGGWFGKVLGQFYQLLFHLASLGQKTVELAWANSEGANRSRLARVLGAQTFVECLLAGALPIGTLALLLAIIPAVVIFLPADPADPGVRAAICAAICAAIVGALAAALTGRKVWKSAGVATLDRARTVAVAAKICTALALGAGIAAAVGWWLYAPELRPAHPSISLFILLSLICLGIFYRIAGRLAQRRGDQGHSEVIELLDRISVPHVMLLLCAALWVTVLWLEWPALSGSDDIDRSIVQTTLRVSESLFIVLEFTWVAFVLAAWATCLLGWHAAAASNSDRIKAAIWTGKIAMVIPATLFLLTNLLFWSSLVKVVKKSIPDSWAYESFQSTLGKPLAQFGCGAEDTVHDCVQRLVDVSASAGFNLYFVMVIAACVLAIVAVLPSVIHESRPAIGDVPVTSKALGNWLDAGFFVLRVAGYFTLAGLLIVLPAVQIAEQLGMGGRVLHILGPLAGSTILAYLVGALVASAGVGVMFRNALFDGLGKALDIALDVDNWLRERPLKRSPRGRVLSRYLALLARVCDAKNGYHKLIIVTHSQGTVITADLLRFLHKNPQAGPRLLPTTLLTFGSPLRQLYALRFPDLYRWARTENVHAAIPDSKALGIQQWVNGYRSGDYVGRYFWTTSDQWQPYTHTNERHDTNWEFCVGAGAHTHYFDANATVVGKVINDMVA